MTSDVKSKTAPSKAPGPLHEGDVPREKIKRKNLDEQEKETSLSKNGPEKILLRVSSINYSMKCIMPNQSRKQYVSFKCGAKIKISGKFRLKSCPTDNNSSVQS